MKIETAIKHLREREYMSGVERDHSRVKATGEVFTPTPLVIEILKQIPLEHFVDVTESFLDPSCGDGQFLSEVIIKKMEHGSTYEQALKTTYGVDLMPDNCVECILRLYGVKEDPIIVQLSPDYLPYSELGPVVRELEFPKEWLSPGLKYIYKVNGTVCNIVCADGLLYDYNFGEAAEPEYIGAGEPGLFVIE